MSREIRFRVRDVVLDCWSILKQDIVHDRGIVPMEIFIDSCNRFKFEQCTGLLDDNKTQIFEGDVIKGIAVAGDNKEKAFVGCVEWDAEEACFYYQAGGDWPCIKPWFVKNVEVIGNIHENKGLLDKI